jgi:hypothetical protein
VKASAIQLFETVKCATPRERRHRRERQRPQPERLETRR